jgi:hypothetical protein
MELDGEWRSGVFASELPALGGASSTAGLVDWRVAPDDEVNRGDVIAAVETDEGVVDLTAPVTGTVRERHARPNDTVSTGEVVVSIERAGGLLWWLPVGRVISRLGLGGVNRRRAGAVFVLLVVAAVGAGIGIFAGADSADGDGSNPDLEITGVTELADTAVSSTATPTLTPTATPEPTGTTTPTATPGPAGTTTPTSTTTTPASDGSVGGNGGESVVASSDGTAPSDTTRQTDGSGVDMEPVSGESRLQVVAANVLPGDEGAHSVTLENNGSASGTLVAAFTNVSDGENGLTEPERELGDDSTAGELSEHLRVRLSVVGNGEYIVGNGSESGYVRLSEVEENATLADDEILLGSGERVTVTFEWRLPVQTGNVVQSDRVGFDLTLGLESA